MKKAEGWMYLSPEGRHVKLVVQVLLPHRLGYRELVIQPFTKGSVPPVKPFGFEKTSTGHMTIIYNLLIMLVEENSLKGWSIYDCTKNWFEFKRILKSKEHS